MEIKLTGISHTYDKKKNSLTNITLQLSQGITGLLGVNGAGKSSLLNILATVMKPQTGQYMVDNMNALDKPGEIRKILGYLPQSLGYIPELSIYDFLQYSALLKGCPPKLLKENIYHILEYVNLLSLKDMKMKSLSGGMKQRVGIAQAIINKPKLLILDEPVVGLDPNERNSFSQLLSGLATDSIIILSSHIIDDIENMCERVILLDNGVLQYSGATDELIQSVNGLVHEALITRDRYEHLKNNFLITKVKPVQDQLLVRYLSEELNSGLETTPSLEDAFIFKTQYSKS
jgi:ABC-2 type transport system ATP-binding protein